MKTESGRAGPFLPRKVPQWTNAPARTSLAPVNGIGQLAIGASAAEGQFRRSDIRERMIDDKVLVPAGLASRDPYFVRGMAYYPLRREDDTPEMVQRRKEKAAAARAARDNDAASGSRGQE